MIDRSVFISLYAQDGEIFDSKKIYTHQTSVVKQEWGSRSDRCLGGELANSFSGHPTTFGRALNYVEQGLVFIMAFVI